MSLNAVQPLGDMDDNLLSGRGDIAIATTRDNGMIRSFNTRYPFIKGNYSVGKDMDLSTESNLSGRPRSTRRAHPERFYQGG